MSASYRINTWHNGADTVSAPLAEIGDYLPLYLSFQPPFRKFTLVFLALSSKIGKEAIKTQISTFSKGLWLLERPHVRDLRTEALMRQFTCLVSFPTWHWPEHLKVGSLEIVIEYLL